MTDFILKNDEIYRYKEMQLVFQKLGNIFSKNKDIEEGTGPMKQFEMDASANGASSAKAARNGLQLSSTKGSGGHSKRLMNKYREIQLS